MHVTVIGGGYGGLRVVQKLAQAGFDLTLIEPRPQLVLAHRLITVASLRTPLKDTVLDYTPLLPKAVRWIKATAVAWHPERGQVDTDHHSIQSDRIVLSLGSTPSKTIAGSERVGFNCYGLEGTQAILGHWARVQKDLEAQRCDPGLLRWVVVGGNASGVALAAELVHLARRWRNRYGGQAGQIQIHLIQPTERLLSPWRAPLGQWAEHWLLRNRVFVQTKTRAKRVRSGVLILEGPHGIEELPSQSVFYATGLIPQPLEEEPLGLRSPYLPINEFLQVVGHPHTYVVGGQLPMPSVALAHQSADYVVQALITERAGKALGGFVPNVDPPPLSLGAFDGVAMLGLQDLTGTAAWALAQAADGLYANAMQNWNFIPVPPRLP